MEESLAGLRQAMYSDWRDGVFARVVKGGSITVGDDVVLTPANRDLFT